jgi:hypothetical protein
MQQICGWQLIEWTRDRTLAQVQIRKIENGVPVIRRQEVAAGTE